MPSLRSLALSLSLGGAALAPCSGCGDGASTSKAGAPPSRFLLAAEPAGAVSVGDARKAAPKDDAVVVGRVREVSPGLAAFTLVDASLTYCGQSDAEDKCEQPWDYCCHSAEDVAPLTVPVSAHGASGAVERVAVPELRSLDLVVVRGRLVKDAKGEVEVVATGWWRKERPSVGSHVQFP